MNDVQEFFSKVSGKQRIGQLFSLTPEFFPRKNHIDTDDHSYKKIEKAGAYSRNKYGKAGYQLVKKCGNIQESSAKRVQMFRYLRRIDIPGLKQSND